MFTLTAKTQMGGFAGGLIGSTYWDWLRIDLLAVDQHYRSQGVGSTLMKRAEDLALQRGCKFAHTTSYGFQALDFYKRRRFVIVGALEDYPKNQTLYWLRKTLRQSVCAPDSGSSAK